MIWRQLTHPAVRDLAWACFSPPLLIGSRLSECDTAIENSQLSLTRERAARLHQLDRDPGPLLAHLAGQQNRRLGLYFESLWHFFLDKDPDTELVAHNLPVREGARTLGEFDIIYFCKRTGTHVHLELAVKFYLGLPGTDIWLGPGQQDRLDRKIAHLTQRQIRLGNLPRAQALLRDLGINQLRTQIEMKGYLFAPPVASPETPAAYNQRLPLSQWWGIDEFETLARAQRDNPGWRHVPRERWLSPVLAVAAGEHGSQADLLTNLREMLQLRQTPQMLAYCDQQGQENLRCFVAPSHWPLK